MNSAPTPTAVIGSNLRKLRQDAGLTQAALALKAQVGRTTIAFLESGRASSPTGDTLFALAAALGVCPSALVSKGVQRRSKARRTTARRQS